ncbi:MAG TPA: NAD(P)/FAD-dependent oxidoreductase [Thermoanaerobaculia bacterium]|jgi:thioredoxin reductase
MTYDAIIIGGGPAGLTCAVFLARYRRPVLVLDAGHPRNAPTRAIHGFLGHHEIAPLELLQRGRAEAQACGAEIVDTRATKIEKNADVFEVTTPRGVFCGRRVVLAYGVRDTLPDIPELESYYGLTVHHCPDCDGFECSDQRIGVIGWGKKVVGLALKLLQWSNDVVVFTHGHPREWDEEEHSKLLAEQIDIVDEKIVALDGADGIVKAAVLETGERVPVQRLFFNIKVDRSCDLAETLGCEIDPEKPNVKVDEHRQTCIEGVWAVGDLVEGSQLAITAAADGAIAAIAINKSLLPPSRQV